MQVIDWVTVVLSMMVLPELCISCLGNHWSSVFNIPLG